MSHNRTLKLILIGSCLGTLLLCGAFMVLPSRALADTGLVAHWAMDNASGTTASDSSGYNNNATINGTATWVPGKIAGALSFNGSTYARVATFNTTPSSTMTLCSWIKTSSATNQVILGFARNPSGFGAEGIFSVLANGSIQFWDDTGQNSTGAYGFSIAGNSSNGNAVDDGHWHSVCFVKNNTAGTYYIDGLQSGTTTAATNIAYDNYDWVIGADYRDNDSYFNGLIDDTRVYDIALSSPQIAALYGIEGYWKFDEGTGTVAYDSSGNNNTGTIVGNPSWITGKLGDALNFGNNQYVSIGGGPISSSIASSGQMTATAWVYANSATASGTIIKNWPGDSSNDQFQLGFQSSTGIISGYLKQGNGTVIGPVESTSSLPLNSWHLVTFTANGSSTILYIDGIAVASTTYNGTIGPGGNYIGIGADLNNTGLPASSTPEYFNGGIDDVHLYNRGLLPEEILTLMEAPPAQVMNLQATGTHTSGFSLTWNANPVGDNVTDYLVQYSTNGGTSWTTVDTVSTGTSYELNNLAAGDYFFRVKAVNSVAQGVPSSQVEINSPVITYNLGNDCLALEHIATNPGDAYGHYVMSANIDCSVVPNFSPISFPLGFGGTFDGGGHTITSLSINTSTNDVGLFSQIQNGGVVENLTLSNANVTSSGQYSGILAGYSNGTIQNISAWGTTTGAYYLGGLVGQNDSLGTISSSSVNVYVIGNNPTNGDVEYVGGLVGENSGSINHSYSLGTVTNATGSADFYYVGGFVGDSEAGSLTYDYATGPIIVNPDSAQESDYIGGFAGELGSSNSVDHSYTTGNISDPDDYGYEIGGFVGYSDATLTYDHATGAVYMGDDGGGDIYYVGGFVGGSGTNPISNCYATGGVTAAFPQGMEYVGGFAGYNENQISNSYSTGNVEGYEDVAGFSGDSTSQLSEVFATGNVVLFGSSPEYGAGLVAQNQADIDDAFSTGNISLDSGVTGVPLYIGGLVSYNSDANINRTYASGNISVGTSSSEVGGLIGEDDQNGASAITNSYSVGAVSGGTDVGGLIGLESIQGSGNPTYTDLSWYNGSASNTIGDFMNNSGGTDNGPIHNLVTGGYGTDTSSSPRFYLTSHPVYALSLAGGWDFNAIWLSHTNTYPTFQWYTPPPASTYTITASAGTGGAISPSGSVSVTSGASSTFTISANSGYTISNVLVDGTSVGTVSLYAFSNVTASHTISVAFVQNLPVSPAPVVQVAGGGGMIANVCMDPRALNYNAFGASDPSLCQYTSVSSGTSAPPITTSSTSSLPVATTTVISCSAQIYPTQSIKFGAKNNPAQVMLLQKYLNAYEHAQLSVDGVYSAQDVAAVIAWQEKYASDILTPWNVTKGTGYIYITSLQEFKKLFLAQCNAGGQSSLSGTALEIDLQIGMSGKEVMSLQQALISKMTGPEARALAKNGISGYFGQLTKSALIEFQKSAGIVPALGYCGPETRAALGI